MTAPERWLRWSLRTMFVVVALVAVCGAAWHLFVTNVGARFLLGYITEFDKMPVDDSELGLWLSQQPGVAADSIVIFREDKSLTVHFGIDQNLRREPKPPDLDTKCRNLGYLGSKPFRVRHAPYSFPQDAWMSRTQLPSQDSRGGP